MINLSDSFSVKNYIKKIHCSTRLDGKNRVKRVAKRPMETTDLDDATNIIETKPKKRCAIGIDYQYAQLPYWPAHFDAYSLWSDVNDLDQWENQKETTFEKSPFHHGLSRRQEVLSNQVYLKESRLDTNSNRPSLEHLHTVHTPVSPWYHMGMKIPPTKNDCSSSDFIKIDELKTAIEEVLQKNDQGISNLSNAEERDVTISQRQISTDGACHRNNYCCHRGVEDTLINDVTTANDETATVCEVADDKKLSPLHDDDDNGYFSGEEHDIIDITTRVGQLNITNVKNKRLFNDEVVKTPDMARYENNGSRQLWRYNDTIGGVYGRNTDVKTPYFSPKIIVDVEMPYVGSDEPNASYHISRYLDNAAAAAAGRRRIFDVEMLYVSPDYIVDVEMVYVGSDEFNDSRCISRYFENAAARRRWIFDDGDVEMLYVSPDAVDDVEMVYVGSDG